MRFLTKILWFALPVFLFSEPLIFSQTCFLIEGDTTSPSMTYDFMADSISGLNDTSLQMFTDPYSFYVSHYQRYSKDYRSMQDLYAQFPKAASLRGHFYDEKATVIYKNEHYMSLEFSQSAFTGGAHPNSWSDHWIIDLRSKNTIAFHELFSENDLILIKRLSDKEIKKTFKVKSLEQILFTRDYEISKDIYLLKNGVVFQYNPYEIAPYSTGPIQVFIPFRKLKQTKIATFIR